MQLKHALAAALALVPTLAHAEGFVSLRGVYYKERSTLVEQPMFDGAFDTAHGHVDAHALVDAITSASSATGAATEFTERRYEVGAIYTHELPFLRLGGGGRYSTESDYTSLFAHGFVDLDLAQKNALLRFAGGAGHDSITNGVAVDNGGLGTPRRSEQLNTFLGSVSFTQILTPDLVGAITYDLSYLDGYQANIYRVVYGGASPVPERVPDTRLRHAIFGSLRGYFCPTGTTAFLGYRFYFDDWGIVAHTPELRLIQSLGPGLDLRLRYRFHTQSSADFYQAVYTQAEISGEGFVTDDEKLSAMHTHTVGVKLTAELGMFGLAGRWAGARLEAMADYYAQNTAFGDAFVGQVALSVPLGP